MIHLGEAMESQGCHAPAVRAYRMARAVAPKDERVRQRLARVQRRSEPGA